MKKKDLELEVSARVQVIADLRAERKELLDELKAQSATINALQRKGAGKAAVLPNTFDDLAAAMSACIDTEIEVSASNASRQWSLVTIRKELQALGGAAWQKG